MIRIQQLKMKPGHSRKALIEKAARTLHIKPEQIAELEIAKQSIDARKKPEIFFSYVADVEVKDISEEKCVQRCRDKNVSLYVPKAYCFPTGGNEKLRERPVIIGTGPAGLFAGYFLAKHGYRPVLLERGQAVEERQKDVEAFWNGGSLNTESNVSFGEGGAGTFSDGKLNTLIKDKDGRSHEVLSVFVENGAQEEILYEAKPHIGTDVLTEVVKNMRNRIISWGGEVRFNTRADGFVTEKANAAEGTIGRIIGVKLSDGSMLSTNTVVLATGHSARDTFLWLHEMGIGMEAKSFAVGLRVAHPQKLINRSQYGQEDPEFLPPSPYKVTAKAANGRGVYSFCMCPGGWIVNAASEEKRIAVNGMSYSSRDSDNANSAIIVAVTPEDFGAEGALSGVEFQRKLEEKAYQLGKGSIPVQRYGDFSKKATGGQVSADFAPCIKGSWRFADIKTLLPKEVAEAFKDGMEQFGHMIKGFDDENVLLAGIESRTSSPVRIHRDETMQANLTGLYPCGEGAGYAGGITSAAMDGMKAAECIAQKYAPFI